MYMQQQKYLEGTWVILRASHLGYQTSWYCWVVDGAMHSTLGGSPTVLYPHGTLDGTVYSTVDETTNGSINHDCSSIGLAHWPAVAFVLSINGLAWLGWRRQKIDSCGWRPGRTRRTVGTCVASGFRGAV